MLGIPEEDQHHFLTEWWPVAAPEGFSVEQYLTARQRIDEYTRRMIEARLQKPGEDMLSAIALATHTGELSFEEAMVTVLELVFGATVNISTVLSNGVLGLLKHPEHFRALGQDPKLSPSYVEEILRLYPHPTLGLLRATTEDLELGGVRMAKGDGVIGAILSANRDPSVYSHPHEFRPDRREAPHLAFGLGPHHCIGAALARMHLQVALPAIAKRFPDLQLACREDELQWQNTVLQRSIKSMPVILQLGSPRAERQRFEDARLSEWARP
jgi:cytochrome P450